MVTFFCGKKGYYEFQRSFNHELEDEIEKWNDGFCPGQRFTGMAIAVETQFG